MFKMVIALFSVMFLFGIPAACAQEPTDPIPFPPPVVDLPDTSLIRMSARTSENAPVLEFVDFRDYMTTCAAGGVPDKQLITFNVGANATHLAIRIKTPSGLIGLILTSAPWQVEMTVPCNVPVGRWYKVEAFAKAPGEMAWVKDWVFLE